MTTLPLQYISYYFPEKGVTTNGVCAANKASVFNQVLVDCKTTELVFFYETENSEKGLRAGQVFKEPLGPHKTLAAAAVRY